MIVNIPIEFPDDFYPPDFFDGVERENATGICQNCPLYYHETYEEFEFCMVAHTTKGDECPIRPHFPEIV